MGTSTCLCLVWNSKFHSPDPGWSNTRRGLLLNIPSRKSGLEVIVVITMHCFKILRSWGPDGISGVCDMLHVVSIMQLLLRDKHLAKLQKKLFQVAFSLRNRRSLVRSTIYPLPVPLPLLYVHHSLPWDNF